jgi:aminoglycoside/choline kinase family phosphotransferase
MTQVERRTRADADVRERLTAYLTETGVSTHTARLVPLTGDASDRRYFRLFQPGRSSIVLAVYPAPFVYPAFPFVNVAELLGRMPVPIPAILGHSEALGILALEDLGDVTLQAHLGTTSPQEHADLYRQAVELIVVLQRRGGELASTDYVPYGVAFDVEKLTWELEYFFKHFIEGYRGVAVPPAVARTLRSEWAPIVNELAAEPRVLCHRDYHGRNLMWHQDRLYIIDFQDARMGPSTYDLVSLLRDSYMDLNESTVDALIAIYLDRSGSAEDAGEFRRRFDLMALQRNLKALGTFGYQTAARRNPVYIQYIPRTLRYVRDNLSRYPRFTRLRQALGEVIEELAESA